VGEVEARQSALESELRARTRERQEHDERLAAERAGLDALEAEQERAREQRVHWQVEAAQMEARLGAAGERTQRAASDAETGRRDAATLADEVRQIDATNAEVATQRGQWQDALQERRLSQSELETAATQAAAEVERAEAAVAQAEAEVETARGTMATLGEEEHRLTVERTELEGRRRATAERVEAEWRKTLPQLLSEAPDVAGDLQWLRQENDRLRDAIDAVGPVNALAVEEHAEEVKRLEFLMTQRDDLVAARGSLQQAAREIDQTAKSLFLESFGKVRENFRSVFQTLFGGGECDVRLANEDEPLESEIEIHAAPRGKRTQRIHLLSSGERTLVAVSLLFAIFLACPSPFCLLDEVDAPLDDSNVGRYVRLLAEFKSQTQFIVITHNPRTMQAADAVYGVTMQEPGVSTIVGVRLGHLATA
jgi:chromosome segregation protein